MAQHLHVHQADEGLAQGPLVAGRPPAGRPAAQAGLERADLGRDDCVLLRLGPALADGPDQGVKIAGVDALLLGRQGGGGHGGRDGGHGFFFESRPLEQ
jgi:hypothetical protein